MIIIMIMIIINIYNISVVLFLFNAMLCYAMLCLPGQVRSSQVKYGLKMWERGTCMVTVVVVEIGGRGRRIHAMNVSKEQIEIEIDIEIDEGGHKLLLYPYYSIIEWKVLLNFFIIIIIIYTNIFTIKQT